VVNSSVNANVPTVSNAHIKNTMDSYSIQRCHLSTTIDIPLTHEPAVDISKPQKTVGDRRKMSTATRSEVPLGVL
jgi:hypothetical protein